MKKVLLAILLLLALRGQTNGARVVGNLAAFTTPGAAGELRSKWRVVAAGISSCTL